LIFSLAKPLGLLGIIFTNLSALGQAVPSRDYDRVTISTSKACKIENGDLLLVGRLGGGSAMMEFKTRKIIWNSTRGKGINDFSAIRTVQISSDFLSDSFDIKFVSKSVDVVVYGVTQSCVNLLLASLQAARVALPQR
jgi:hypothetical protein